MGRSVCSNFEESPGDGLSLAPSSEKLRLKSEDSDLFSYAVTEEGSILIKFILKSALFLFLITTLFYFICIIFLT